MPSLASGEILQLWIDPQDSVSVANATVTGPSGPVVVTGAQTFGPYDDGASIRIVAGASCSYTVSNRNEASDQGLTTAELAALRAGVSSAPSNVLNSRPTVLAVGTSLVSQSSRAGGGNPGACPYYAHLQMTLAMLGNPWQWVDTRAADGAYGSGALLGGLYGWGGGTSAQIEPYALQFIQQYRANFVFVEVNDNDTSGTAEDTAIIIARTLRIVDAVTAAGGVPILFSGAPSTSFSTSGNQIRYWTIHRGIEAGLLTRPTVIYIPLYSLYTDTSQTFGPQPINSGLGASFTDGIHPRVVAFELAAFCADRIRERVSVARMTIPTPGSAQLLSANNLLCGSTAGGSGLAGNVPTGFNTFGSLTALSGTVTCSKVLRFGKEVLQVDVTTTAAQVGATEIFQINYPTVATGWAIGDLVGTVADIEFDAAVPVTGVKTPQVQCTMTGAATSYPTVGGIQLGYAGGGDTLASPGLTGRRLMLATPPAPVPAVGSDAVTSLRPYFFLKAANNAAAITMRMWMHSFSLINYSR